MSTDFADMVIPQGGDLRLRQATVTALPGDGTATIRLADQAAAVATPGSAANGYVRVETGSATSDDIAGVRMINAANVGDAAMVLQTAGTLLILGPVAVVNALEGMVPFSKAGTLTVSTGKGRFRFPFAAVLIGVTAAVDTAPTGASLIADVKKNGATVYGTNPGNRPTIAAGANATAAETVPDTTTIAVGDYLTVDTVQVGSTVAGADLTVIVRFRRL